MGQLARINARKKFCANDVIPMYESYYQQIAATITDRRRNVSIGAL
jgi:hypothetical protein